jgi:ribosome-associated heat shock protein Hsp15
VALDRSVRVLKVAGFAERRGPAETARALWEDLTPAPDPAEAPRKALLVGAREPGAGRPTKRDRRTIEQFTGEDDP